MPLEPQRASIEARRNAVSDELSRLCLLRLHGDPQESGQDDFLPRVQTLHAERDALEADLQALTDPWGKRVTESADRVGGRPLKLKLPALAVFCERV